MAAPSIYRSTDAGAPQLIGGSGALINLLDAILVNGYGATLATGFVTNDGTMPADGDTLIIGANTYTFKTSLTAQPANTIGLTGATTTTQLLTRIAHTINGTGTAGTDYTAATLPHPGVYATYVSGSSMSLTSRRGGSAANVALVAASPGTTHLSVSGATMTGGGGTDTKVSAGWTKAFTDSAHWGRSSYKQPAGCGFYLMVDDSGPGVGQGREARAYGFETMTAYNTGTNQFPTVAQASVPVIRKSNTLDGTLRPWIAYADDRTFYLFTQDGNAANSYLGFGFGDFYSLGVTDSYKCMIMGGTAETTTSLSASTFAQQSNTSSMIGHWIARNFTGLGGSTAFVKTGDMGVTSSNNLVGSIGFPNPIDGGLYVAPIRVIDASTPGTTLQGTSNLRGRIRGLWHICHPVNVFADGDPFAGAGEYAGRNFVIVKFVWGSSSNTSMVAVETTPWDTSA